MGLRLSAKFWPDRQARSATENDSIKDLVALIANAHDADVIVPFRRKFAQIRFAGVSTRRVPILEGNCPRATLGLGHCYDIGPAAMPTPDRWRSNR
jgi:hypothetical protein